MTPRERAKKYSDARHGQMISEGVPEVRRKKSAGIRNKAGEIFGHALSRKSIFAYMPTLLS
jgi:hypothetical protein